MKEKIKVIFLDIDGVLNDYMSINKINEENIFRLKRIVDKTNAKIVISSSRKYLFQWAGITDWKKSLFYLRCGKIIEQYGIQIYDFTPWIKTGKREDEIDAYLKANPNTEEFLILDDDEIINKYKEHEIYIDLQRGLQEEHIEPALNILNGNLKFYYDYPDLNESIENRVIRMNRIIQNIKDVER